MTLRVEPLMLRSFSDELAEARQIAEIARRYVNEHGTFSIHEQGLIGLVGPGHRRLLTNLNNVLEQIGRLADESSTALRCAAQYYEDTDLRSASAIDGTFPVIPRPSVSRE